MNKLILFFVLITMVGLCRAGDDDDGDDDDCGGTQCPKGEVWIQCGRCCQPSCDDRHPPGCHIKKCCPGCFCPKGYIRKYKGGPCIKEKDCPIHCPKGEIYQECGPCCPATCDRKHPHNDGKHCKGCYCPKGYIREYVGGPCIKDKDCPCGFDDKDDDK